MLDLSSPAGSCGAVDDLGAGPEGPFGTQKKVTVTLRMNHVPCFKGGMGR